MATSRVWLITGASSGFGRALTEFALKKGDRVVATLRKPEVLRELTGNYSKDKLLPLKVDVTNQVEIDHAFARTKGEFGKLDVVFNNAGHAILGDAETTPVSAARAMLDVNFWGAVGVSQAAIKFFRDENKPGHGGVLLQNSSIAGISGSPGLAFYSASKQALSGYSECLAREILPQWNIKICILASGGFNTNVVANMTILPVNPVYNVENSLLATIWNGVAANELESHFQGDPAKFAKAIYSLVESGRMPLHFPIGQDALTISKGKVEALDKDISEAAPWSADLLRDDVVRPSST